MNFNLLPWRMALYQQRKRRFIIEFSIILFFSFLFTIIFQIETNKKINKQIQTLATLQYQLSTISKRYLLAENILRQKKEILKKFNFLNHINSQNQAIFVFLEKLPSYMPKGIYLTNIQKKSDKLFLEGESISHTDITYLFENIAQQIKQQPIISDIMQNEDEPTEIHFNMNYSIIGNEYTI